MNIIRPNDRSYSEFIKQEMPVEEPNRLFNGFSKYINSIDKELEEGLASDIPMIREIGKYSLLSEGKRLRPLLFVLSGLLCGYQKDDIYYISTMFEYIHCASLLHDDVIDNANTRRNKPSASVLWGNSAAVLTGDFLSSRASRISISTGNIDIIRILGDTVALMTEGQFLELVNSDNWNTTRDEYMEIITRKTAELISICCASGAVISGAEKEFVDNLRHFGINLGISFQMVDDLLDYVSSEEKFGKPVGKDLREGKITLPLIYTLKNMDRNEAQRLKDRFESGSVEDKDFDDLILRVRESGNIEKIRAEAQEYVSKASEFLNDFPGSVYKNELLELNEYIAKRSY